ncbi:hypothetical protein NQ317_006797 [Molorchus minor]|uniref:Cytochrome P450 n=1 Tax=Molorchus minor TaxID=1323400 RepID=A0ABQ9IX40_9CUCU|nr:hypothetical protein NQ317_006797 [Molorchus minor]
MSTKISRKLLKPKLTGLIRAYSTEKQLTVDRLYSTAIGVIPENYNADVYEHTAERVTVKPKEYKEIPGPKELPVVGNAWRFAPIIGQYKIHELDKVGGLIGHPDLLFVFNGDDIQKVFRREEVLPHRPSMPSLHYYKQHLKRDFFEGNEGVIGVHGPKWDAFRKQVQQILLPPSTAKKYIEPLNIIATDFFEMEEMLDENSELPEHFSFGDIQMGLRM